MAISKFFISPHEGKAEAVSPWGTRYNCSRHTSLWSADPDTPAGFCNYKTTVKLTVINNNMALSEQYECL